VVRSPRSSIGSSSTEETAEEEQEEGSELASLSEATSGRLATACIVSPSWRRRPGRPVFHDEQSEAATTSDATSEAIDRPQQATLPLEFTVVLDKSAHQEEKLGLSTVSLAGRLGGLLVQRVNRGLVERWNLWHPDQAVQAGDRIVGVNGQRGDADLLWALVAVHARLSLVIQRDHFSL